jgi:hypothetical protein
MTTKSAIATAHTPHFEGSARFTIERSLGAGGMGVVYLAHDRDRDMRVALKTLANADPGNLARLKSEFRALAGIAHPNLAGLYELFAEEGRWFFTMEAIDGVRFDAWVARRLRLGAPDLLISTRAAITRADRSSGIRLKHHADPVAEPDPGAGALDQPVADLAKLRRALAGLVDGIEALHREHKLHCDLKPSNVLITPSGRVVVLDFGLVRERPREGGPAAQVIEGTPEYLAPEIVRGAPPTFASDWYPVGVMIFHALSGSFPHRGPTFWATLAQKLEQPAPRVSSLVRGVPPGLDALCAALLEREPSQRAGGAAIRRWLDDAAPQAVIESEAQEPAFVGRAAELEVLRQHFEDTRRQGARAIFVRGPSGMGKSALVRHFTGGLEAHDLAIVLAGRCYEREQVPFKTLDNVVDVLAAHLARMPGTVVAELVPESAAALAVLFPVLLVVDAIAALPPPLEGADPSTVRALAAEAARTILRRLAATRPVVIAIDDLQWGDLDSAGLLADIVDAESEVPLLFVASVRSEAAGEGVVAAFRHSAPRPFDLELGALDRDDGAALARSMLGEGADDARALAIVEDAGGLPFFVAELARFLGRHAPAGAGERAITLDGILAARIDELSDDARGVLEAASLAGVPLGAALLARASGLSRDPLPALRLLGARSLIRTRRGAAIEIEPYHDRIREVVAARLSPGRKRALHAGLGDVLAAEPSSDPEAVSDHLARGGDVARALPFQLRAAERALHAMAFERAVSLYDRALEQCSEGGAEEATRARVRESLAGALVLAGRASEAAPLFLECAAAAKDDRTRARLERRGAEEWLKCGRIDEGVAALRGVLADVGLRYPDSQQEALARAIVRILRLRFASTRFDERAEAMIPDAELARVDAARAAGIGLMLVDPLRGYGFLARFLLDALRTGEPRRVSAGLSFNAVTLCRGGEAGYARAKAWLDQARAIGARLDDEYLLGLADACEAGIDVCTGRWEEAAPLGLGAPERLRSTTTPATWECTAAVSLSRTALLFGGDLARLRTLIARHLRAAEDVGDLFAATYARVHGYFVSAMDDDIARGRADIDAAIAGWSHLGFHGMHFWALYGHLSLDLYEGEHARGLSRLAVARPALARSRILAMQFYRVFLAAAEANLELGAAAGAERGSASERAARIAITLEKEGPTYARALATLIRARIAVLEGRRDAALALADRAVALFGLAGMRLYVETATAWRGALRGGDDGTRERDTALVAIASRGIAVPERFVAMLAG